MCARCVCKRELSSSSLNEGIINRKEGDRIFLAYYFKIKKEKKMDDD